MCSPAHALPVGRHLVRVHSQPLWADVGAETGCWMVPSGWYYTDTGRSRIAAAVDHWQGRLDVLEGQLTTLRTSPPPGALAPPPRVDALPLLVALCLGFLLGLAAGRLKR